MTILDTNHLKDDIGERKIFLGTYSGFQRFDVYQYKFAKQIEAKMRNAFWNPEEISMNADRSKFQDLPSHIQEILTQNLLFQTVMDSTQSRGLESVMVNLTTSPEWEAVFRTQGYFEQIHSLSYSHIIREMYPDATVTFDRIGELKEIQNRVNDELAGYEYMLTADYENASDDSKRESIVELCVRILALEGVKFYVSFLLTYMINHSYGNSIQGFTRIIKLINFDEDMHVSVFAGLLNTMKRVEREGFMDIINSPRFTEMVKEIFNSVKNGEMIWGKHLLSIGRVPSITMKVLDNFVTHFVNDRMALIGVGERTKPDDTTNFFNIYKDIDKDNVAGQEAEGLAYNVGILKDDIPAGPWLL